MATKEREATMPGVRMSAALLDAVRREAQRRDETVAQVVRRAMRDYVGRANVHEPPHVVPREPDGDRARRALGEASARFTREADRTNLGKP